MSDDKKHTGCSYESAARLPESRKKIVNKIVEHLKTRLDQFDGIAISGYSMSMVGSVVADRLDLPICVVSKDKEQRNSPYKVEGLHSCRWIMIDDLVSSCRTLERVYNGVRTIDGDLVGVILWESCMTTPSISFAPGGDFCKPEVKVPLWMSFNIDTV